MAERLPREVEEPGVISDNLDDRVLHGKRRKKRTEDRAGPPKQWRSETYVQEARERFTWFLLGTWAAVQAIGFTLMAVLPADIWSRVQSTLLYVMGGSLSLVTVAVQHWFAKGAKK